MRRTEIVLNGGGLRGLRDDAVIIDCGAHELDKCDDE